MTFRQMCVRRHCIKRKFNYLRHKGYYMYHLRWHYKSMQFSQGVYFCVSFISQKDGHILNEYSLR
jgi:hypothetical protein